VDLQLPGRYEPLHCLGKGGGGEVWAVRDRLTQGRYALKLLADDASQPEMAALVREAVALSGLEGLGVPRVIRFGRLPDSGRPFMVRELVEGQSLLALIDQGTEVARALDALARAAAQLTELHRAGLLHGDIKPANVIVEPAGRATLVDLGLSAPWREAGVQAEGITPKYAAPELFEGKPLTVRAEVFALGATLVEALEKAAPRALESKVKRELEAVAERATADEPSARFPSADEFASALRRAAGLSFAQQESDMLVLWPIVGIDTTSARLLEEVRAQEPGELLQLEGPPGSGRSALLRRVAWSLGVEGRALAWIDEAVVATYEALEAELNAHTSLRGVTVLVDDADTLEPKSLALLRQAREQGARLVTVGEARLGVRGSCFQVPPLDEHAVIELMRRAVPSLTDRLLKQVFAMSDGRPGQLRRLVAKIASEAVASVDDIARLLGDAEDGAQSMVPAEPLEAARYFLDRGRFNDARTALDRVEQKTLASEIEWARLELGLGDTESALERMRRADELGDESPDGLDAKRRQLYLGRACLGVPEYDRALQLLEPLTSDRGVLGTEALSYQGLGLAYIGRPDEALSVLERAVQLARASHAPRQQALALSVLGVVLQRQDRGDEARETYERAIAAAETASDAGLLASTQLNLAGLLKVGGDIAGAIEHFEAAVDMGRRSGRRSTTRIALLNLANTDLYLGRLARARASIEAVEEQRSQLAPGMLAQLTGLQAELQARLGDIDQAVALYQQCAAAYEAIGRGLEAAEARLEAVLVAARARIADPRELKREIELGRSGLADAPAHRPLLLMAEARVAQLVGNVERARPCLEQALAAAREAGQKEWIWRALEARSELEEAEGQQIRARRDREEALAVLEEIGARLPRDLREVYWNDPRRRALRSAVARELGYASTAHLPVDAPLSPADRLAATVVAPVPSETISSNSAISTPLERRLARILEINSELVGMLDLDRLTARVTDHAVDLLRAERGFVLLLQDDERLSVHTSRTESSHSAHAEFSRSIAQRVIATGEPVVSLSARDDARLAGFASVHQMMLHAVACVPVMAPSGKPIGALYVETRHRPGAHFERELPTLRAFGDQVAIAIETARLINENKQRADELADANQKLEQAQGHLRELLGDRTAKLKLARRKLRHARDTLYGHFGYQGLVGTSAPMRRVYALMERVKTADVPVLITGESGTGKEMVARGIHAASPRGKKRFLGINCGAMPENLLESELFGHVRGAFTGADRARKGLFREAEGGSVLLDEIGEMPHRMQASMLRVLQERKVRSVGGTVEEPVDVRLIFATNRDLEALVKEGKFREDLYYRIHVVELPLPPLRERREDIPQLVDHFLGRFAARYKRERGSVSRQAMRRLMDYDWPGNVRQLEHVLLNAWVLSDRAELDQHEFDLPDGMPRSAPAPEPLPEPVEPSAREDDELDLPPSERVVERGAARTRRAVSQHQETERERIMWALKECNWNRVKAAEVAGIPRRTFYRRLRQYGIQ
jgi:serine/threonine-protein kinase PknK